MTADSPRRRVGDEEADSNAPRAPKVQRGGDLHTVAKKKAKKSKKSKKK